MRKLLLVLIIFSSISFQLYAAREEYFHAIGFSDSGAYFAYEKIIIPDPLPFAFYEFTILNTDERFAVFQVRLDLEKTFGDSFELYGCIQGMTTFTFDFDCFENFLRGRLEYITQPAFEQYDITKGQLGDYISNENGSNRIKISDNQSIILEAIKTGEENSLSVEIQKIKILLADGGESRLIHADGKSPLGSEGAYRHRITEIYKFSDRVVIVVEANTPGFEGANNEIFVFITFTD
ncbi:MAG: DUF2259 domain-containing protein [Candidatus Bipolaricaulia bacterium]